jgi:hypothetical protein
MAETNALACADTLSTARRKFFGGQRRSIVRTCMKALAFDHNDRAQGGGHLNYRIEFGQWHGQPRCKSVEQVALNHHHLWDASGSAVAWVGENVVLGHRHITTAHGCSMSGGPEAIV